MDLALLNARLPDSRGASFTMLISEVQIGQKIVGPSRTVLTVEDISRTHVRAKTPYRVDSADLPEAVMLDEVALELFEPLEI